MEVLWQMANAADWSQTRTIATEQDCGPTVMRCYFPYYEANPILGERPTVEDVDLYFAASLLFHLAMSSSLQDHWKDWWQRSSLALELGAVGNNYAIGLSVRF
jgi:hypothetical protein